MADIAIYLALGLVAIILAWVRMYWNAKKRIEEAEERVTRVKDGSSEREGQGIWISTPIIKPDRYDGMLRVSKPIIVVGNLKGGVGKTTVAANLAAHYSMAHNEKVLIIDADYQGSISSMLFTPGVRIPSPNTDSLATKAFAGISTQDGFRELPRRADQPGMVPDLDVWGIPAYYDLAQAENRLLIEWVIKAERPKNGVSRVGDRDIRYFLTEFLHDEGFVDKYDRIIIDAPPRLTSACVQAFCAATHLLIPTVLDRLSGEAVATFVEQIKLLRDENICQNLKMLGVVPYVPTKATKFKAAAREQIQDALMLADTEAELYDEQFEIPSLPLISESTGERIAYATDANGQEVRRVREIFDRLGEEVSRRIAATN